MIVERIAVLLLVSAFLSAAAPIATDSCTRADPSFSNFLHRFKVDQEFRYSRVILPLRYSETEPESAMSNVMITHNATLTLAQLRSAGMLKIVADPHASNSGDLETEVCEDKPKLGKSAASFVQYSCHTDIFSKTYRFVRRSGCWMLRSVESAGE